MSAASDWWLVVITVAVHHIDSTEFQVYFHFWMRHNDEGLCDEE